MYPKTLNDKDGRDFQEDNRTTWAATLKRPIDAPLGTTPRIFGSRFCSAKQKRFNKGSISVSEGAFRHFGSHPRRVFSFSYGSWASFHGANACSNPAGDAILSMICVRKF